MVAVSVLSKDKSVAPSQQSVPMSPPEMGQPAISPTASSPHKPPQEVLPIDVASIPSQTTEAIPSDGTAIKFPSGFVKSFGIDKIDSAGGVEVYFLLVNPNTTSAIKYLTLKVTPFNAVGDVITSEIGNQSTASLGFTGPLANEDGEKSSRWGPVWYNTTTKCIKIESIHVTFLNGESLAFTDQSVKSALAEGLSNDCKIRSK